MMAHQQFLHELLKEDQEPFHLKTYISDRRTQLRRTSQTTTLQVKKKKPIAPAEISTKRSNLCKHACFFSFHNSPDVRKSPFLDFPSPAMSPCKSPAGAVFLHVPSRTAALLVEAAMRIQKRQQTSKPRTQMKNVGFGFGLFGSFLKRLKDRSKNKKRALGDSDLNALRNFEPNGKEKLERDIRISRSCSSRGDLEVSNSTCRPEELDEINGDFASRETQFCSSPASPFRFSLHRSSSSSGRHTPDFSSPAASPLRQVEQEKKICVTGDSDNVQGEEEEKEQCSPVSVLDPFFEDEGHESNEEEEDAHDLECSYANVERAKQQLLRRLRRFEKLAELDPMELEKKLLESSDDEYQIESVEYDDHDEPFSPYRKQGFLNSLEHNSRKLPTDMKCFGNREALSGRICSRLDSWREVEFDAVKMMIELNLKEEFEGWRRFCEEVEEAAAEVELAIFGLLVEELSEELFLLHG